MDFADRLLLRRNALGMTQADLGDLVGVNAITVRRWEKRTSSPSLEQMGSLAHVLNTTIGYLTGETDDPKTMMEAIGNLVNTGNAGGDITQTTALSQKDKTPWWVNMIAEANATANKADPRELSIVAHSLKLALDIVEQAQQAATV